ncbi:MAG: hypothetical protein IJF92_00175 [Bacilli bacterium]|nr:hypothetical protein [Bacilli bacterium]MBQ3307594.1 hypothetical protein [Bacilli bacterium]
MNHLNNITQAVGFRSLVDRNFPEFRVQIYDFLKYTMSDVLTREDLDVVVRLITEIFGDLYMRTGLLPWQIDTDKCPAEDLEALGSLIGYRWNPNLSTEQQRVGISLYCLIRRNRGSKFGLENLIRSFGQTMKQFYSNADLRGVEIIEYGQGGPETLEPVMFPGDIIIRVPEFSSILRDSIFDTKLAGTRIFFQYYIFIGIWHMEMKFYIGYKIVITPDRVIQGYNPIMKDLGEFGWDTVLSQILDHQWTHGIRGNIANNAEPIEHKPHTLDDLHHGNLVAGIQILTYYKDPWKNGFILNTPGLTNYRGFVQPDGVIQHEHILYK